MLQVHFRDTRVSSDRKIPRTSQRVWNFKLKSGHSERDGRQLSKRSGMRLFDGELKCRPRIWAGTDSKLIPSFFSVERSQTCS